MVTKTNTTPPNGLETCRDHPGDQPTDNAVYHVDVDLIFPEDSDTDGSEHSIENTSREDQLSRSPSEEGISEHTTERIDEDPVRYRTLSALHPEYIHSQPPAKRQRVDPASAFAPTDSSIAAVIAWKQPDEPLFREDIILNIASGTTTLGNQESWTFDHICWKCSSLHFKSEDHAGEFLNVDIKKIFSCQFIEKMHQQLIMLFGPSTSWAPWPQTKDSWDYALNLDNAYGYLSIRHVGGQDMDINFIGTEISSELAIKLLRFIKNTVEMQCFYEMDGGAPIIRV